MNDQFLEQQSNIKFCMKLGKNASDTYAVLTKYYGGEAMKKSHVFKWHKQFKESSHGKIMMMYIIFFNIEGIIHSEFIPQGHTVNQA
jgi:hypothetical protein